MLRTQTDIFINARGLSIFKTFNDIDGPGIGNSALVEREERPNEGGIYNYLVGYKYPYKGSPHTDGVNNLHTVKKFFKLAVDHYNSKTIIATIGLLIILPRWLTRGILRPIIEHLYSFIDFRLYWDFLDYHRYCISVREIHRAFTVLIGRMKDPLDRKMLEMARNLICMSFEYDSAYRFRFQDIMAETSKEILLADTKGEINRLFEILLAREIEADWMRDKFLKLKKMISLALSFWVIKRYVKELIRELDIEKLKPDEGDRYFDLLRKDYDFMGKSLPERIEMRKKIEGDNWKYFEPVAQGFLAQYKGKQ